jgi:signal transduction histidine kinase
MKRRLSIRTRITLVGVGVVSLVLCCFSASLFGLISRGLDTDRDKQLSARADAAVTSIATAAKADLAASADPAPIDPRSSVDIYLMVLGPDGTVLRSGGEVDGAPVGVPIDALKEADQNGAAAATVPIADGAPQESLRMQIRRWNRPDLGLRGYVVAVQTSRRVTQDRAGLFVLFLIASVVAFAAAAVAVWVATGRALRPLRQTAALADEIAASADLSRRLPGARTPDAVGHLATSFNTMMDRVQEAYGRLAGALEAQQRFTGDASHELRTPLTTIRNNAEFLLQHPDAREDDRGAALRDIAGESVRMARLVENLLTLARADAGQQARREPVDLVAVVEAVCRQSAAVHDRREIRFAGTPAPPVSGDEDMLRQLTWILLDNAVKYTADGGAVWVAVTQRGTSTILSVADDGVGIPPGMQERIFQRFFRADAARTGSGSGLGLAIAAWIVHQHGGSIVAANNDRGGATFSVDLPVAGGPSRPAQPLPGHSIPVLPARAPVELPAGTPVEF